MQKRTILIAIVIITAISLSSTRLNATPASHQEALPTNNLKTSTGSNPPTTTISCLPVYISEITTTNVQLMPGQDFSTWDVTGPGGTTTVNTYTCVTNNEQIEHNLGYIPDGFVYEIRAKTSTHTGGSSFEFEMCNNESWFASIHVTEQSGNVYSSNGNTGDRLVLKEKPVNEFYNIRVQIYNSNYSYHLWVDNVNCGMLSYEYNGMYPQKPLHWVVLTSNSYVTATFSNLMGKTFITPSTSLMLNALNNSAYAVTSTKYKVYESGNEIRAWQVYSTPFTLGSSDNGSYRVFYCSINSNGDNESLENTTFYIDTIAPTTVLTGSGFSSGQASNQSVYTLPASDNSGGSGLNQTWVKWGGEPWHQYTTGFSISERTRATITIFYCSWDNAGNNETLGATSFTYASAPNSSISYTPKYIDNGYLLLNFEDNSLHISANNTDHVIEDSSGPETPTIISDPANPGQHCMNLTSPGNTYISWLWMKYTTFSIYQVSAWFYLTNNYTNAYINLIHTDLPISYSVHNAMAYIEFHNDGHAYGIDMMGESQYDLGVYPLNQWFSATIVDNRIPYVPYVSEDTYNCYINSVYKGTFNTGGVYTDINSFSVEANGAGAYVDDYQMNTPLSPGIKPDFVTGTTTFNLSTSGNVTSAIRMYKVYYNTTNETRGWQVYSSPFTIGSSENGTYTIFYDSSDMFGNESLRNETVYIDAIAPVTAMSATHLIIQNFVTYALNQSLFTLNATENSGGSGLNQTWVKWTGHPWVRYILPFSIHCKTGEIVNISYCSWDNAGNNRSLTTTSVVFSSTPTAPLNVTSTAGDRQVVLAWTIPEDNGYLSITGYNVYIGTTPLDMVLNTTIGNVTTCTIENLTNGQTYYFLIQAINVEGTGNISSIVSCIPVSSVTPPPTPTPTNIEGLIVNVSLVIAIGVIAVAMFIAATRRKLSLR